MLQEPRAQSLGCGVWPLHGGKGGGVHSCRGPGARGEAGGAGGGVTSRWAQPTASTHAQQLGEGWETSGVVVSPATCITPFLPSGSRFRHLEVTLNAPLPQPWVSSEFFREALGEPQTSLVK